MQGTLPHSSKLSSNAKCATILEYISSASRVSLGQLCGDGCDILFKNKAFTCLKNDLLLQGKRNKQDGLWDIHLYNPTPLIANNIPPNIHLSIYPSKPSTSHTTTYTSPTAPKHSKISTFKNIFQDMENIINIHKCTYLVNQQMKEDRRTPERH